MLSSFSVCWTGCFSSLTVTVVDLTPAHQEHLAFLIFFCFQPLTFDPIRGVSVCECGDMKQGGLPGTTQPLSDLAVWMTLEVGSGLRLFWVSVATGPPGPPSGPMVRPLACPPCCTSISVGCVLALRSLLFCFQEVNIRHYTAYTKFSIYKY